ncbi:MAG TPA: FAD-dependent monooxygenase [Dongiaceae bacterium]|jgi:2-polyprenyl-6-methoxyphenol hydroxylase-like FAD-dependent oxidoreductase
MMRCDVLIAGAGPTGLALALWLTKQGLKPRIIDKTAEPGTASRALAVQARTLELYRQLDLTDAVVERGHKVPGANFWVKGKPEARIALRDAGEGLTPYPFLQIFPQDQHERLLIDRLTQFGIAVERQTELLRFSDMGDRIAATLRGPGGQETECEAAYIAGCDGARSIVRETIGTGFPGGTYRQVFYVADVQASGPALNGELHVDLDEADFLAVFPMAAQGRARLIGTVRNERAQHTETLKFEDVSSRAIENLKVHVEKVNWFSTYHVHHRVTENFRKGRAFLLGDAAHIHSPAGGQGMNTGIGDAINLAWKLVEVLAGRAPDSLLDSYEAERRAFARKLVATTDRVFSFATAEGRIADILRTRIAPLVLPRIAGFEFARDFLFKTVSQVTLNYRDGPLSLGTAGQVHGGDRLPWISIDGADNFASLAEIAWQAHVYGTPRPKLNAWCAANRLKLLNFPWHAEHATAGLAKDALYLLRPDTYVALADATGAPEALERYFTARGISVAN